MAETTLLENSLVLYKSRPARVVAVNEKVEIQLEGGNSKRVRPKDIVLLHSGPLKSLTELQPCQGELDETWELLNGTTTHLSELTELMFGDNTPVTTWAAWQLVAEGLYFRGTPEAIEVRTHEEVEQERATRMAKEAAQQTWSEFMGRVREGKILPEDRGQLGEVERLALGLNERSQVLRELNRPETPESAHHLLLKLGYWSETFNPYPLRLQVPLEAPAITLPLGLSQEARRDLTHLTALAIDDEGNQDPDDAISLDGDRIWVHVADVAALITPNSELDREARARGANLYLPDRIVPMLPDMLTDHLGLGLNELSPALSIGFSLTEEAELTDIEVVPSLLRVTRLSYTEAQRRLQEPPLAPLFALTQRFRARRQAAGAAQIELPEVNVRVEDGEVIIRPIARLDSRDLVTDAMLMAGEAAARFAHDRHLPVPFATQAPPDSREPVEGLAAMFAQRKLFKPTQMKIEPQPHAGLGLEVYTRCTSPLRRYSDLLVHQQLRAHLQGVEPLDSQQVSERVNVAEIAGSTVRKAERLSNTHWKLVHLLRQRKWRGKGTIVELRDRRATILIPELALEARVVLKEELPLDKEIEVTSTQVDLPELWTHFRVNQ